MRNAGVRAHSGGAVAGRHRVRRGLTAAIAGLVLAAVLAACTRAPIDITAQAGFDEITLSWVPAPQQFCPHIDGYAVFEGTSPGAEDYGAPLVDVPTDGGPITTTNTWYTVQDLTYGRTYYFTIRTVGDFWAFSYYRDRSCYEQTSYEVAATVDGTRDYAACWYDQLCVTTLALPQGEAYEPYGTVLGAEGGVAPYSWSFVGGDLPGSVTLGPDGSLAGTLGPPGRYRFEVEVTDSATPTADTAVAYLTIFVR